MIRKIIKIDEEKCNGCGLCVGACHEGAIGLVHGKAKLLRDDYCDGLGNCLPVCPTGAISFEEREAVEYDESAVAANKKILHQWPIQIQLVPINAPFFENADLLVAADCTAFAYPNIHSEFMRGKVVLIGCPKLDDIDYSQKLSAIFANNKIKSVTALRMEVPCCGGIERAVKTACRDVPLRVVTVSVDGRIVSDI